MPDLDSETVEPLSSKETVCPVCWLAYWTALGECSNCDLWPPSAATVYAAFRPRVILGLGQVDHEALGVSVRPVPLTLVR